MKTSLSTHSSAFIFTNNADAHCPISTKEIETETYTMLYLIWGEINFSNFILMLGSLIYNNVLHLNWSLHIKP